MLREAEATVGMKMLCQMTVPWTTMSRLRTTAQVRLPCRSEWTLQVSEPPFTRSRPKPHRILQRQLGFGFRIDGPRLRGPTDAEHGPNLGGPTGVLCENRFCSRHGPFIKCFKFKRRPPLPLLNDRHPAAVLQTGEKKDQNKFAYVYVYNLGIHCCACWFRKGFACSL